MFVFHRRGSVQAEIKVFTVVNLNKTNEVDARNHLIYGIKSALKKSFNIIALTILGKLYNYQVFTSACMLYEVIHSEHGAWRMV